MKKQKLKNLVKSAGKIVRYNIKSSLAKELSSLTQELGQGSKKMAKGMQFFR